MKNPGIWVNSPPFKILISNPFFVFPLSPACRPSKALSLQPPRPLPFDVIVVSQVMPLPLLLHTVQHGHGGHEVHYLPSGQQVKVGPAVSATVAIAGDAQGPVKEPVLYCTCTLTARVKHWALVFLLPLRTLASGGGDGIPPNSMSTKILTPGKPAHVT